MSRWKPRKTKVLAERLGTTEKAMIENAILENGSQRLAAVALGLTEGELYSGLKAACGSVRRIDKEALAAERLSRYNARQGTSYDGYYELVKAVDIDEVADWCRENELPRSYVESAMAQAAIVRPCDDRPSNLPGPWTDRERCPCRQCEFVGRNKNEPGCVRCVLRQQYDALTGVCCSAGAGYEFAPVHQPAGSWENVTRGPA